MRKLLMALIVAAGSVGGPGPVWAEGPWILWSASPGTAETIQMVSYETRKQCGEAARKMPDLFIKAVRLDNPKWQLARWGYIGVIDTDGQIVVVYSCWPVRARPQ